MNEINAKSKKSMQATSMPNHKNQNTTTEINNIINIGLESLRSQPKTSKTSTNS